MASWKQSLCSERAASIPEIKLRFRERSFIFGNDCSNLNWKNNLPAKHRFQKRNFDSGNKVSTLKAKDQLIKKRMTFVFKLCQKHVKHFLHDFQKLIGTKYFQTCWKNEKFLINFLYILHCIFIIC